MRAVSALKRGAITSAAVGAALMGSVVVAAPAHADPVGNWDAPPTCFTGAQWHFNNFDPATGVGEQMGVYEHQGEVTEYRVYGGGYEVLYFWVYTVSYPGMTGPDQWGMVDAGVAYKHCGTTWHPYTA